MYPKMHWRRRLLIEFGWNTKEKLNIFLKYEYFKWYSQQLKSGLIPTNQMLREIYFRNNLQNFIKTNQGTSKRIFKTGLMDQQTENHLFPPNISVTTIENDIYSYLVSVQQNQLSMPNQKEKEILLNHFDLQKTRCPDKIINLLNKYEKINKITTKADFLNFREYYNKFVLNYFNILYNQRNNSMPINLYRTSIISEKLESKNLLCIGEMNIISVDEFNKKMLCLDKEDYKDISFKDLEIDIIGGDTLYMLVKNYNKIYDQQYKCIINTIIQKWNDYIIQDSFQKILTPKSKDFIEYMVKWLEIWHQNNSLQNFYCGQRPKEYLKFVNYETSYL